MSVRNISDDEDAAITAAAESDPDNPPLTDAELARMRPMREVMPPAFFGRPPSRVTLEMEPEVIGRFQEGGGDWRMRMADVLRIASHELNRD